MRKVFVVLSIYILSCYSAASADMILTLSGDNDSSTVGWSLSGSDTWSAADLNFRGLVFDITDGSDPFPAEILNDDPIGRFNITGGSGNVTNETSGIVANVLRVTLQESSLFGVARFGVGFDEIFFGVTSGDVFSWSGSGTFDLSAVGLSFGDFQSGVYDGFADYGGLNGRLVIESSAVVAEPGTLAILGIGLFALAFARRRAQKVPAVTP